MYGQTRVTIYAPSTFRAGHNKILPADVLLGPNAILLSRATCLNSSLTSGFEANATICCGAVNTYHICKHKKNLSHEHIEALAI